MIEIYLTKSKYKKSKQTKKIKENYFSTVSIPTKRRKKER